jgi:site-specific recombinase XerD
MTTDDSMLDAIATMMRASNIDLEALAAHLDGATDDGPTIADYAERCLTPLKSEDSRRSYRTHLRRLCDGIERVCSCDCEACAVAYIDRGDCGWSCAACNDNPLEFVGIGDRPMRDRSLRFSDLDDFVALTERIARKRGTRHNAKRRSGGLGPKAAHGQSARRTCVLALSRLFQTAKRDRLITWNPAEDIKSGVAVDTRRRALTDTEVAELLETVASAGDDPELDLLIVWASLELGNRRAGLLELTMGDLNAEAQLVAVHEKFDKERQQPASAELLSALVCHAATRGGNRCVPDHPEFDPTAPVLYQRRSTPASPRLLGRKRFETLHARVQRSLPWASEMGFSVHCIRYTAGTMVERIAGTQVARKFLGHGLRKVTDRYTDATMTEIATAFSLMTGRDHPAAER